MASKDPFNILHSRAVAPIVCDECGNNMHCVRRTPDGDGERQRFHCVACNQETERTVGLQESDAAVQQEAEKRVGLSSSPSQP
jgi:hypothetical protein